MARSGWKQLSGAARMRLVVIPVLLVGGLVSASIGLARSGDWDGFALNLGTELIGAVVTFVLLDLLLGRQERHEEQEKEESEHRGRLVRQMRSKNQGIALQAVEELRANGWLSGDTLREADLYRANLEGANLATINLERATLREAILQGAYMRGVNLEGATLVDANCLAAVLRDCRMRGADLSRANLERADLRDSELEEATLEAATLPGADLRGVDFGHASLRGANLERAGFSRTILERADLSGANLRGARSLTDERLQEASALRGATLPDGTRYDGRFHLPGDIAAAKEMGVDPDDARVMAEFYGVPVKV